ncbi:MAG TPA: hypothetical protein VN903_38440 [Polyangia bacterium]|nr:hypothetical protein [Polyangia bacterium]
MAPVAVALVAAVDCSVDRSGLGGAGGTTMVVGSGGSAGGMSGSSGAAVGGDTGAAGSSVGGQPGTEDAAAGRGGAGGSGEPRDGSEASDVPPAAMGCADGTREAFADPTRFPAIAGCAGGWSVPGLLTERSLAPGCARAAGNDGSNATGLDCTVEDLCADGWHVCRGASELTQIGVTCQDSGIAAAGTAGGGAMFFATRQRGTAPTGCSVDATTGSNNLHGCGNFGRVEDPGCAPPLDRQLENTVCAANPPWSCNDPTSIMTEATVATKLGSARGGVLCCRD